MLRSLFGGSEQENAIVLRVVERAEGVPLVLEEFARSVAATSGERPARRRRPHAAISDSLYKSLIERLDQSGPARHLVDIAAVIGGSISPALLARIGGLEADIVVESGLRQLRRDRESYERENGPGGVLRLPPRAAARRRVREPAARAAARVPRAGRGGARRAPARAGGPSAGDPGAAPHRRRRHRRRRGVVAARGAPQPRPIGPRGGGRRAAAAASLCCVACRGARPTRSAAWSSSRCLAPPCSRCAAPARARSRSSTPRVSNSAAPFPKPPGISRSTGGGGGSRAISASSASAPTNC